jgi:hypothetical protein
VNVKPLLSSYLYGKPLTTHRGAPVLLVVQLTYWSLQQYDHVPAVRQARKALAAQMTGMLMNVWHRHKHVCENFSPHKVERPPG